MSPISETKNHDTTKHCDNTTKMAVLAQAVEAGLILMAMLLDHVYSDWEEPSQAMKIEAPYGEILGRCLALWASIRASLGLEHKEKHFYEDCVSLYCLAPALPNVLLNYKICIEHGLPLHPTRYYELKDATSFGLAYDLSLMSKANELFKVSIDLARRCLSLSDDLDAGVEAFSQALPPQILNFVYTGRPDKYTWRASEPERLRTLAASILSHRRPGLLVGAAHGSIMPGLALAELLGCPLYFIRFSMFKREDEEPVISPSDEAFLKSYADVPAILFDEDVAKGHTLARFVARVSPFFREWRSAAVIRHASAAFKPDHVGAVWWE